MAGMATATRERGRTVSGTTVAIVFILLAVGTILMVLFVTPAAQRDVLRMLGGTNDRQVLGRGAVAGQQVEVIGILDEATTCVEVAFDGATRAQGCIEGDPAGLLAAEVVARSDTDPAWILTGMTDPGVRLVRLDFADGTERILTVNRPRGYRAGFWFADRIDPAAEVTRVVALDTDDNQLAARTCTPYVATAAGVGADCTTAD
jgi:hypothetical protein